MKKKRSRGTGKKPPKSGCSKITTRFQMKRLFEIVAETQKGKYPNCTTFQKIFEVESRRTILRDIDFLRDQLKAPLEFDRSRNGYHLTGDFHLMPSLDLKDEDFLTLHFLRQSLAPYEDTEIGNHMKKSFERMFGLLIGTETWKNWDAAVAFRGVHKTVAAGEQLKIFEVLFSAINAKQVIRFDYLRRGKEAEQREVEPCLIVMNQGRWSLVAAETGSVALQIFGLGRIRKLIATQRKFVETRQIKPEKIFQYSFGIVVSDTEPKKVVIDFTPGSVELLYERIWHPSQQLEALGDGSARLSFILNSFDEIRAWILSWGQDARVVEPPELKAEIELELAKNEPKPFMRKLIIQMFSDLLPERQRQVLEQRFGFVDGYSKTIEEVSRQFRTTRERIAELEYKALRILFAKLLEL